MRKWVWASMVVAGMLYACQPSPPPEPQAETREECMARLDAIDPEWRMNIPFECDDHPDPETVG